MSGILVANTQSSSLRDAKSVRIYIIDRLSHGCDSQCRVRGNHRNFHPTLKLPLHHRLKLELPSPTQTHTTTKNVIARDSIHSWLRWITP